MGRKELIILMLMVCMHNIIFLPAKGSWAEVYSSSYEFQYDLTVDRTDAGTETDQIINNIVEVRYSQKVLPRLDVDLFLKFELENEFKSDDDDTTRLLPETEITGTADFWEMTLGAKRDRESTDEPFEPAQITDNYFLEFLLEPGENVPDLKLKYTVDTDEKSGETDTSDTTFEVSSVYDLGDIIKLKVDYNRDESDDRITADSDTIDKEFKTEELLKYIFSDKIKFDFKHQYQKKTGATLLDAGGNTNETNTKENTFNAKFTYLIFPDTDLGVDYKFEREEDKIENVVTKTQDFDFTFDQDLGEAIGFSFSYSKTTDEEAGPITDIKDTEDQFTYDLDMIFSNLLDFTMKYENTLTDTEDRVDTQNSVESETQSFNFSWTADTETFWVLTTSYTWSEDKENDVFQRKDRKISLKSDFAFDAINLKLTPNYSLTVTEDFTKTTDQETRTIDFNFSIDYGYDITEKLGFTFNHRYGRKVDQPGKIIQRDDDTTLDFTLDEPWRGSSFNLGLSRNATDTSGDDSEADITTNITFGWDHSLGPFDLSLSYKFDKNNQADNSETFDVRLGWVGLNFDTQLTYSFDKTFSTELDESHSLNFNVIIDI